jgi:transcriptional regulator with XRE-family HTH domain
MSASENVAKSDITPEQSRAARGLLDWSRDQLAEAAGVPKRTIMRFEGREVVARGSTIGAIRAALEAAGVAFIPENGGGPGVRMRERKENRGD